MLFTEEFFPIYVEHKGTDDRDMTHDESSNLRRLSVDLAYANFRRVHGELHGKDFYPKLKYALLASLVECDRTYPIDSFLPLELREAMSRRGLTLNKVKEDTLASYRRLVDQQKDRLSKMGFPLNDDDLPDDSPAHLDILQSARYLLLSQGADLYDWFLTKEHEVGILSVNRDKTTRFLPYLILQDILPGHPELKELFAIEDFQRGFTHFYEAGVKIDYKEGAESQEAQFSRVCGKLRDLSLAAFAGKDVATPHLAKTPPPRSATH